MHITQAFERGLKPLASALNPTQWPDIKVRAGSGEDLDVGEDQGQYEGDSRRSSSVASSAESGGKRPWNKLRKSVTGFWNYKLVGQSDRRQTDSDTSVGVASPAHSHSRDDALMEAGVGPQSKPSRDDALIEALIDDAMIEAGVGPQLNSGLPASGEGICIMSCGSKVSAYVMLVKGV